MILSLQINCERSYSLNSNELFMCDDGQWSFQANCEAGIYFTANNPCSLVLHITHLLSSGPSPSPTHVLNTSNSGSSFVQPFVNARWPQSFLLWWQPWTYCAFCLNVYCLGILRKPSKGKMLVERWHDYEVKC